MKYITLPQPWASLVCHGIVDIADAVGDLQFRGRVIVVSSSTPVDSEILLDKPYEWVSTILNAIYLGNLPEFDEMKTNSVIGTVDIIDCVKETYSMWDNEETNPKWRLANPMFFNQHIPAKALTKPTGNTSTISQSMLSQQLKPTSNKVSYDNGKLRIPVGESAFNRYSSGEYRAIDLFIDEDIEICGLFPDPSLYTLAPVDTIEISFGQQRALFSIKDINAGVRIDNDGNEISMPSIYEPERPWECLLIDLGLRKMWISK